MSLHCGWVCTCDSFRAFTETSGSLDTICYTRSVTAVNHCAALHMNAAATNAGFQPIPALQNLEGLLNSLAPGEAPANLAAPLQPQQQSKADSCVQHRGSLGFLQGFLKLQQALTCVAEAKDHRQVCLTYLAFYMQHDKHLLSLT